MDVFPRVLVIDLHEKLGSVEELGSKSNWGKEKQKTPKKNQKRKKIKRSSTYDNFIIVINLRPTSKGNYRL